MLVWVADRPEQEAFAVPDGVTVESIPSEPLSHPHISKVEVLVPPYRSRTVLDALPGMPALRLIQTLESGVEWLLPSVPPGIFVCNSRGAHDAAVAEWVVGAILVMQRRVVEHLDAQRRSEWRDVVSARGWLPPFAGDLEGSSVLIVGYGSIGRAVEERLRPFGVEVQRVARHARPGVSAPAALPRLVGTADIVILLLPSTSDTDGLFDSTLIEAMKRGALLVNAGRGRVVDQRALLAGLIDGRLRAALDVTEPEPLPADDPLWSAPNLLLTPHIAGDTPRRFWRSWRFVGEQVGRMLDNAPLQNVVVDCSHR
ncbi:MAG TPA: NAD(P)-dependent oxidoreductase [Solirubrobacterales bacterium]